MRTTKKQILEKIDEAIKIARAKGITDPGIFGTEEQYRRYRALSVAMASSRRMSVRELETCFENLRSAIGGC